MRRQKRDKSMQAYVHGFAAGIKGQSFDLCPYLSILELRSSWFDGWREGRSQHFWGFTGTRSTKHYH